MRREQELIDAVLAWLDENMYACVDVGDGEEYNVYDEPPEFVKIAQEIKNGGDNA